jgi:hypothetical protein
VCNSLSSFLRTPEGGKPEVGTGELGTGVPACPASLESWTKVGKKVD